MKHFKHEDVARWKRNDELEEQQAKAAKSETAPAPLPPAPTVPMMGSLMGKAS